MLVITSKSLSSFCGTSLLQYIPGTGVALYTVFELGKVSWPHRWKIACMIKSPVFSLQQCGHEPFVFIHILLSLLYYTFYIFHIFYIQLLFPSITENDGGTCFLLGLQGLYWPFPDDPRLLRSCDHAMNCFNMLMHTYIYVCMCLFTVLPSHWN